MNNAKFAITTLLFVLLIAAIGFVGWTLLDSGSEHMVRDLERENQTLAKEKDREIAELNARLAELENGSSSAPVTPSTGTTPTPGTGTTPNPGTDSTPTGGQHAALLTKLKALRTRGVTLEPKDRNADVGTIQQFLNVYFNTSAGIDNDFGATTRSRIEQFQKDQKISADGGVGAGTLAKMISWLESRS